MVKDVGVGPLSVIIAVLTRGVTSMISVVRQGFSVPTALRHFFIPSVVVHLVAIPNAWAEVFGANKSDVSLVCSPFHLKINLV